MRKITAGLFITLDGVIESPEKWSFRYGSEEVGQLINSLMAASDTLLLGRRTYQEFAAVWPDRGTQDPIGAYMNDTPKLVASTTLRELSWPNSTLVTDNVVENIAELKKQPGKNINMSGSATLVRSLLQHQILDELHLLVCPIVLGTGDRLFDTPADELPLRLIDSQPFSSGVVAMTYGPESA